MLITSNKHLLIELMLTGLMLLLINVIVRENYIRVCVIHRLNIHYSTLLQKIKCRGLKCKCFKSPPYRDKERKRWID